MADLVIPRNELLPRLMMVSGAVDKKQSLVILSNILLSIKNNRLNMLATDLEIEMSAGIDLATSHEEAEFTVPAKKFVDIIRSLDEDVCPAIKFKEDLVTISVNRSHFKLATLSAENFPRGALEEHSIEISLPRAELVHLLNTTHFAMSQQDVRVYLNGMLLEFINNSMTAVATDGHRMAICRIDILSSNPHQRFFLSRKSIQEMLRILNAIADESVIISAGKSYLRLTTQDFEFTSKLIDTQFPPYSRAIPKGNDKFVLVERDFLKRALSRIVILAHEKSRAVLLHIHAGGVTLIANNQEKEEAVETVEAQVDGQELKIGINANYLMDVLNIMPDSLVRLSMSTTDRSILVESVSDDSYQYIIMPMKL